MVWWCDRHKMHSIDDMCPRCADESKLRDGAIASYRKHFTDPVQAAEQDLVGQMIAFIRECSGVTCYCRFSEESGKKEEPKFKCIHCKARAILAQTKDPTP
jgi:hypothetical protein